MNTKEVSRLDEISKDFTLESGKDYKINIFKIRKIIELCEKYGSSKILDMGCADGTLTNYLSSHFKEIYAIDSSASLIKKAKMKCPSVIFNCSLFEEFYPDSKFDMIIAGHILEHVESPSALLNHIYNNWLERKRKIVITVPNKESLHRRLGLEMGLITDLGELTEDDFKVGHRRYYSIKSLKTVVKKTNFRILETGGIMIKPLSNRQMFAWDGDILEGLYKLSQKMPPEFGGELYIVAKK